jgi:VWFA-related protein
VPGGAHHFRFLANFTHYFRVTRSRDRYVKEGMALPISRRSFLYSGAAFASYAWAQEAQPTFSSDVSVVNVFATVHDKQGKVIRTLTKEDFLLEDEGRPQPIRYFSQQSDLPLTLGLLVDTSGSMRNSIESERSASLRFFEQVMRPDKDRAFVIHFDSEVELLQDLTSSRKELEKSLDDLAVAGPKLNRAGQGGRDRDGDPNDRGGYGGGRRGGGTKLYDSVLLASDELMRKQQGRKAVILLTDGVDRGSSITLTSAMEAAQRADTLIYAIRFPGTQNGGFQRGGDRGGYPGGGGRRGGGGGIGYPGGGVGFPGGGGGRGGGGYPGGGGGQQQAQGADGKKVLMRLAEETGGSYNEVSGKKTLGDIYMTIEDELRSQYNLGFSPDKDSPGYHRLKVSSKEKGLIAQARTGYYLR